MSSHPDSREWGLGWPEFKLVADERIITHFLRYGTNRAATCAYQALWRHLGRSFETSVSEGRDESQLVAARVRHKPVILVSHSPLEDCVTARVFMPEYAGEIREFALKTPFILACDVQHSVRTFKLKTSCINVSAHTGVVNSDDDPMRQPHTLYEFRIGHDMIAKALISYENSVMLDCAPTITHFEVQRKFRGKGLGTKCVRAIEENIAKFGFDRIWATSI